MALGFNLSLPRLNLAAFRRPARARAERPAPSERPALLDTGQGYRALWWVAHVLGSAFVVSMLGNAALGLLCVELWQRKEIVPMILTTAPKADQIVRVEPFEAKTRGFVEFTKALLKGYVEKRETIDLHTEVPRWQEVNWMSSDAVWLDFKSLMQKSNPNSPFEHYKKEGVTRAVHVRDVTQIGPHVFQVAWDSFDSHLTQPRGHGSWVSTITVAFEERSVRVEDQYMNPIGLQVVGYSVDRQDIGGKK